MKELLKLGLMLGIAVAFFPFENHLWFLAGLSILLSLVMIKAWSDKESVVRDLLNPYSILMFLVFTWSVLSVFWVKSYSSWLNAVGIIGVSLVCCLVLTMLGSDTQWRKLLSWYIMLILAVHHLIGWYFVFNQQLHLSIGQVLQFNLTLGNPTWFFRNINDYALMMFFSLFYALALPTDLFDKPKWQENYKLAKKITDEINKLHPSLAKPVLVKSGRYNQHVSTNAILLEMGSNLNPLDEVLRAVPYVAKAIREVFK